MRRGLFGFLFLAGIVAGVPAAEATTLTTVITANFFVTGALDGQQTVSIPGFSGPGTLTSVEAIYTVTEYALSIYVDASQDVTTNSVLAASNTLSLTQAGAVPDCPPDAQPLYPTLQSRLHRAGQLFPGGDGYGGT